METLDEKGFVFLDGNNRPYWCRMYGGNPWYMYWHEGQKSWVTLRRVNGSEVMIAHVKALPEYMAEIYHKQHNDFINV